MIKFTNPLIRHYKEWKVKHLILLFLLGLMMLMITINLYNAYSAVTIGVLYTKNICEHYDKGIISGSLCQHLCKTGKIELGYHLHSNRNWQLFQFKNLLIRTNSAHGYSEGINDATELLYAKPAKGTSMEDFWGMVQILVESKLGTADHQALTNAIMDVADANKDDKVSLAEAKTIWALLQHNSFFMTVLFRDSEHIPKLLGFCGDNYAVEYVHAPKLFEKGASYMDYFTSGLPNWKNRARISVGLLEFTMEAFQQDSEGPFHMCEATEKIVGYTNRYDVKITDLSLFLSSYELSSYFSDRKCSNDAGCVLSKNCFTYCKKDTKTCSDVIEHSNLPHVCLAIKEFLGPSLPEVIEKEFNSLIARCVVVKGDLAKIQVEQSLVLNELKSLIWKQIS